MLTDLKNNIAFILYDTRNLPVKVYTTNKMVINYVYDIEGNRINNIMNNSGYRYIYGANGQTELREKIVNGSVTQVIHNIFGNDLVGTCTVTSTSSEKNYFLKDHLGSIKVIVNEDGSVSEYNDYDPFGLELTGRSNSEERYKFTGKERDTETSYDYFGARYYDSRIGRWLQVDPLAEKYTGWSTYNYTMNNPLKFIDPKGMDLADYFNSNGDYIGSDNVNDGRIFVLNENQSSSYEKNITELQDKSTEIASDSELGTMIRTVYAEMRGGDNNAKSIVAESIRNRAELPKGTYERANGTYTSIVNKFYDVTKKGDGANNSFKNPQEYIYNNSAEKNAWISSIGAALKAVNSNSDVGKGVIFYHSTDPNFRDNNKKLEKIILDYSIKGVKGLWKLK